MNPVYIIIVTILVTLLVYFSVKLVNEGFEEYFGSGCMDYVPYRESAHYAIKPNTIFISVASYRDSECSDTISSIYANADHPENIYVGICQQNNKDLPDEVCIGSDPIVQKYITNINVYNLDYTEAKGPTYARYWCSTLWTGQEYYFQIDSHTKFVKGFDTDLLTMIKASPDKTILSCYPPTEEQLTQDGVPIIDSCKIISSLPVFYAGIHSTDSKVPIKSPKPFVAAGFMFLKSDFLFTVPYDPMLSGLFQGEEVLFSARLFTDGYNVYAPNKKICSHHYAREGPLFFKDIKGNAECRSKAEKKVLFLLGLTDQNSVAEDFLRDHNRYGLCKVRDISEFWTLAGLKVVNGSLELV